MDAGKIAHRLWIDLAQPFHTYGDQLRGRITFKTLRPIFVQFLTIRFTGEGGCIIDKSFEEKKLLFDDKLSLVSSGQFLSADNHVWEFKFYWPQRGEVDLIANFEPERTPPLCYFRYELTGEVEFIDLTHRKGSICTTRSPTFVSSRAAATEPNFRYRSSSLAANLNIGAKFLSAKRNETQLSPVDFQRSFCAVLKTPWFVITKSPMPISITLRHLASGQPSSMAPIRLVKFEIQLKSKLDLRYTSGGTPSSAPLTATIDFDGEHGFQVQKLASFATPSIKMAPTVSVNEYLELAPKLDLKMPHIRSSFTTEFAVFAYTLKIKAGFEYLGHKFTAKWSDIAVDILPHYIQRREGLPRESVDILFSDSSHNRQPSFEYISSSAGLRSNSRIQPPTPPRTPSPLPIYEREDARPPAFVEAA